MIPTKLGCNDMKTCGFCCYIVGASMLKWTFHDACLVLSESDSKLCTNFKFCEEENHKILIYKAKAIYDEIYSSKNILHSLDGGAISV